jgi:hypothetical protein
MSFLNLPLGKPFASWEEKGERIGPAAGAKRHHTVADRLNTGKRGAAARNDRGSNHDNQRAAVLKALLYLGGGERVAVVNVPWYTDQA